MPDITFGRINKCIDVGFGEPTPCPIKATRSILWENAYKNQCHNCHNFEWEDTEIGLFSCSDLGNTVIYNVTNIFHCAAQRQIYFF